MARSGPDGIATSERILARQDGWVLAATILGSSLGFLEAFRWVAGLCAAMAAGSALVAARPVDGRR